MTSTDNIEITIRVSKNSDGYTAWAGANGAGTLAATGATEEGAAIQAESVWRHCHGVGIFRRYRQLPSGRLVDIKNKC